MNDSIAEEIQKIFRTVFEDNDLLITSELNADDVALWDSLTHMEMIAAVEEHFNIKIPFGDVIGFKNAGDLIACVERIVAS